MFQPTLSTTVYPSSFGHSRTKILSSSTVRFLSNEGRAQRCGTCARERPWRMVGRLARGRMGGRSRRRRRSLCWMVGFRSGSKRKSKRARCSGVRVGANCLSCQLWRGCGTHGGLCEGSLGIGRARSGYLTCHGKVHSEVIVPSLASVYAIVSDFNLC